VNHLDNLRVNDIRKLIRKLIFLHSMQHVKECEVPKAQSHFWIRNRAHKILNNCYISICDIHSVQAFFAMKGLLKPCGAFSMDFFFLN